MPELLLELGCEELPASFVRKAYLELARNIEQGLTEAEVPFTRGTEPMGTPRRLIVHFQDVAAMQPDRTKPVRGPALKAAYDAEGKPTKALEGFCRGQGVGVTDVRVEGEHVWVSKSMPGVSTVHLLGEILPKAIRALTFDKAEAHPVFADGVLEEGVHFLQKPFTIDELAHRLREVLDT